MNLYKPYKLHPHPWTADKGQIREAHGWAIGSYPYTLGDETDHSSGELMAKAPEMLEAIQAALDVIDPWLQEQHILTAQSREMLETVKGLLSEAIK